MSYIYRMGRGHNEMLLIFRYFVFLVFLFSFQCHLALGITCFYFQRLVGSLGENSLHGS